MTMHKEEKYIINDLTKYHIFYEPSWDRDWETLLKLPLGQWSPSFCENESVLKSLTRNLEVGTGKKQTYLFRLLVEKHLVNGTPIEELNQLLETSHFISYIKKLKETGRYLREIDDKFILSIFESKNETLIDWIKSYFPTPPQYYTTEKPEEILNTSKIQMESELIETIIANDQKELARAHLDKKTYLKWRKALRSDDPLSESEIPNLNFSEWAKESLNNANTPYEPKCDKDLANRIMNMAKKITDLNTANRSLESRSLANVLDNGLYSDSALADLYMPYDSFSSLPNAVTLNLGLEKPNLKFNEDIILEFNLEKILQNQPIAYYTQKNLSSPQDSNISTVHLGDEALSFSFISIGHYHNEEYACALSIRTEDRTRLWFDTSKSSLISSNLENIHEQLILNFFRFLDHPVNNDPETAAYVKNLYEKLAQLSDEELKTFLTEIQLNFTKTAQLNIYKTHQIDFDTLNNIRHAKRCYSISVPQLIKELNSGSIDTLHVIRVMIPELLESTRFKEYLISQVNHPEARSYLEDLNKLVATPESNQLVQNQLRHSIETRLKEIETETYPALGYINLLSPQAWYWEWKLSLSTEIMTPVYNEGILLAREKLLKYVESIVQKCIKDDDDLSFARFYAETYIPKKYIFGEDVNKSSREKFLKLCEECYPRILEEYQSIASQEISSIPQQQDTQESERIEDNISTSSPTSIEETERVTSEKILSQSGLDNILEEMGNAVTNEPEFIFAAEGQRFHNNLSTAREEFLETGNSNKFVYTVKENVKQSEPILQNSPRWKQFLCDILNAAIFILTLGTSYLFTKRIRFFHAQPSADVDMVLEIKEMQHNLTAIPNNSPEISRSPVDLQKGFKNRMTAEREELDPKENPQNHKSGSKKSW